MIEISVIGPRQVVRAWFRRNLDWTENILVHDKPKFIRKAKAVAYPRTWKYKYSNRRRKFNQFNQFGSNSDMSDTVTVSSLNSF